VTRNGGGAALPVRRSLLSAIVAAAVSGAGSIPVTAKFRMGVDDEHLTYLDTGRICEDQGCAAVALHARTAFQLYSGDAAWDAVARLKAAVTSIPVLGNGDIWDASDALDMVRATGCDGVVVGRGCLGRPWMFRDLADAFEGRTPAPPPELGTVCDTMVEHLELLREWHLAGGSDPGYAETHAVRDFRKHTGWYLKGYPVGNELRRRLNQLESRAQLAEALAPLPRDARMLPEGHRAKRGHQNGPRVVSVPHGWYEHADSAEALDPRAESVTSGG
jgi:nifR3 family TIM-barrel protein